MNSHDRIGVVVWIGHYLYVPRFSLSVLLRAQRARGAAELTADGFVEELEIGEPDLDGNFLYGACCVKQQVLRPLELAAPDVSLCGLVEVFLEKPGQLVVGDPDFGCECGNGQGLRQPDFDQANGFLDGGVDALRG